MRSRQNVSCGSESLPPSEIVPQTKGLEFSRLPCTIACTVISLYEAEKNRNVVETSEIPDLKTIRKKKPFRSSQCASKLFGVLCTTLRFVGRNDSSPNTLSLC